MKAARGKRLRERDHQGCLTGAARGDVPDDDDRHWQRARRATPGVHGPAQVHEAAEHPREGRERSSEQREMRAVPVADDALVKPLRHLGADCVAKVMCTRPAARAASITWITD